MRAPAPELLRQKTDDQDIDGQHSGAQSGGGMPDVVQLKRDVEAA